MAGIIGKKIGMTTTYDSKGKSVPCTVLHVGPCVVTQIKRIEKDQYNAVQLGYQEKKDKNTTQPLKKHFEKASTTPKKKLVEFKNFTDKHPGELQLGDTIQASDLFEEGEHVNITSTSKGKGFQGVVKRHGFHGVGERTHGQHNRERAPGAIGACATPSRVFKGMKMAGRMGGARTTVQNLRIIKIIPEENIVSLQGCVPGAKNTYLTLNKR